MTYQLLTLVGRLGSDPTMKFTPAGDLVTSFSVATDRKWTDAEGRPQEKVTWFRVTCWRKLAETTNTYLSKGKLVLVVGELAEPKPFQAKDGTWKASLDVTASTVRFLSPKSEGGAETTTTEQPSKDADAFGQDIPF